VRRDQAGLKRPPAISHRKAASGRRTPKNSLLGWGFGADADFGGGAEAFVICVFDGDTDVDGSGGEAERIVGVRISGDPEIAEKIFAVGGEVGEAVFSVLSNDVWDGFAEGFDDLKIVIVDPDAAVKVALFLLDDLRRNVKDVGGKVVDLLATDISNVVFGQLVSGESEGLDFFEVVQIFLGHSDSRKCVGRSVRDFFKPLSCRREENVALDFVVAVGNIVGVERLHLEVLGPGIGTEKLLEGFFSRGEFLDDLIGRESGRFLGDGRFLDPARDRFGFDGAGCAGGGAGGGRGREWACGLRGESCGEEKRGERERKACEF